jgi:isocitrate dehydrogenase kinase/phosphatase
MIFAEFYGQQSLYADTVSLLEQRIAAVFRARPADVVIRHVAAESDYEGTEIWVELSSEDQLARHGKELAQAISQVVKSKAAGTDVWVLYRIVPLDRVYLNGEPRRRGYGGPD